MFKNTGQITRILPSLDHLRNKRTHQGEKVNKKGADQTPIVDEINPIYTFQPVQGGTLWSYTHRGLLVFY